MYQNHASIEKELHQLSLEELLRVEAVLERVLTEKLKQRGEVSSWEDDFLSISQWSHLGDETPVKVDSWKIETF